MQPYHKRTFNPVPAHEKPQSLERLVLPDFTVSDSQFNSASRPLRSVSNHQQAANSTAFSLKLPPPNPQGNSLKLSIPEIPKAPVNETMPLRKIRIKAQEKPQMQASEQPQKAPKKTTISKPAQVVQALPVETVKEPVQPKKQYGPEDFVQCRQGCGRKFNPLAIEKHEKACKLVFQSKRKQFNMQNKRMVSKEQAELVKKTKQDQKKRHASLRKEDKDKWKKESQQFREAVKEAKDDEINGEQTKCDICGEVLNAIFLKKHIESCTRGKKLKAKK